MVENLDNFNFNLIFFSDQPQYSVNLQLMEKSIYVWHLVKVLLFRLMNRMEVFFEMQKYRLLSSWVDDVNVRFYQFSVYSKIESLHEIIDIFS